MLMLSASDSAELGKHQRWHRCTDAGGSRTGVKRAKVLLMLCRTPILVLEAAESYECLCASAASVRITRGGREVGSHIAVLFAVCRPTPWALCSTRTPRSVFPQSCVPHTSDGQ